MTQEQTVVPETAPATDPQTAAEHNMGSQPKPEALSQDPQAGAAGDPNRVPSAESPTGNKSLMELAQVEQPADSGSQPAADQTQIKVFDGPDGTKIEAAATPNGETGAFGQALPPGGEVAGGNIAKVLDPPSPAASAVNMPLTKERAAMLSPVGRKLAPYIQRPPSEWGIIGPGETVRGHMFLLDLNTGEKVRAMDDHRVNDGQLYLNLRNLPESLSTGDTIEKLLGAIA